MSEKILVFTATYNEAKNIEKFIKLIDNLKIKLDLLVVDDNSPDGTSEIIKKIKPDNINLNLISRPKKEGLDTAHKLAFRLSKEKKYDFLITMDADLSHDPIKIPDFLSDELVATNFLRAMTVEMLINRITLVDSSKTILVTAASGGVGRLLCQWATSMGVKVIGSVGSQEKIEETKLNGCIETFISNDKNFSNKVLDVTNGKGVDIVFDSVGNDTFQSSLSSLAHCGYLINFGQSSGPVKPVLMSTLAEKSLSISRPILFHYFGNRKNYENMAASVFKAFEDEIIKVSEFLPFDLKDASNAHDTLESRKGGGSIYLVP